MDLTISCAETPATVSSRVSRLDLPIFFKGTWRHIFANKYEKGSSKSFSGESSELLISNWKYRRIFNSLLSV